MVVFTKKQFDFINFRKIKINGYYCFNVFPIRIFETPSRKGESEMIHADSRDRFNMMFEVIGEENRFYCCEFYDLKGQRHKFYVEKWDLKMRSVPVFLVLLILCFIPFSVRNLFAGFYKKCFEKTPTL